MSVRIPAHGAPRAVEASASMAGWAPLRAAEAFLADAPRTPARDRPLAPLSQLPVPESMSQRASQASPYERRAQTPLSSLPMAPGIGSDEKEVSDAETWGDVVDDVYEEEIAPITRARLRLRCGIPALDTYAGTLRTAGAFATHGAYVADSDDDAHGFPLGSALEIVGPPGIGKTTWVLEMAVRERLAHILHSLDLALDEVSASPAASPCGTNKWLDHNVAPWCAQVVLADTEGSITPACLAKLATAAAHDAMDAPSCVRWRTTVPNAYAAQHASLVRCILQGLHVVRLTSLGDLLAFLGVAADSVLKVPGLPPRTSLLVVDSLSFLLNTHALAPNATREQRRARANALALAIHALTTLRDFHIPEHDRLTVIVTNQMASRMPGDRRAQVGVESVLVPSLTAAPTMRGTFDASAYDWGPSILGRSAWRFLLFYPNAQEARYVALLT